MFEPSFNALPMLSLLVHHHLRRPQVSAHLNDKNRNAALAGRDSQNIFMAWSDYQQQQQQQQHRDDTTVILRLPTAAAHNMIEKHTEANTNNDTALPSSGS
jgi:hypothetical protein